jgi:hypothetical protein
MNDEETLQVVQCERRSARYGALYEASRRGSEERWPAPRQRGLASVETAPFVWLRLRTAIDSAARKLQVRTNQLIV